MKKIVLLLACAYFCAPSDFLRAQESSEKSGFPGLKKTMPASEYEAAGLQKLTADERAALDDFVRNYISSGKKISGKKSVAEQPSPELTQRPVKESKTVTSEVVQSRIVGPFTGYNGHTTFTLENGQKWTQAQEESGNFQKLDSPPVLIVKGEKGYRMYIAGGGDILVQPVK